MRPCILLISPRNSYRITPYLNAARNLNIDAIVVSEGEYSLVSAVAAGIHVDFSDSRAAFDQITAALAQRQVQAVIGTDDMTVALSSQLSQFFGLQHNDPAASLLTRRKDLARDCLADKTGVAGTVIHIPRYRMMALHDLLSQTASLKFPCVIKPLSLSGSRGVIRVDSVAECIQACDQIERILEHEGLSGIERTHVLIEQYIPGYEYAYEGLLNQGELTCLALFDKPDLMEGPFFEETYYITPSRLPQAQQVLIHQAVQQACEMLGLRQGPIHAEVRLFQSKVWLMELASRTMGGDCGQLIEFVTGKTIETLVLEQATGGGVDIPEARCSAGVMMMPVQKRGILRRVEGLLAANRVPGIESISVAIPEGYELVPLPEGYSYLGFIFARADRPDQVESALRNAWEQLEIVVSPVLPVL